MPVGLPSVTRTGARGNPPAVKDRPLCSIVPMSSDYRLSPALTARLVGTLTVGLAGLVFAATLLVALLDLHTLVLLPVAAVGVLAILAVGATLRRVPAVHLGGRGYRVRLVRGAGVREAGWKEVTEATTASPRGIPCVLLKLRDGGTTTIPVQALAADREEFVRDLQRHLQRGQGLRPLDGP